MKGPIKTVILMLVSVQRSLKFQGEQGGEEKKNSMFMDLQSNFNVCYKLYRHISFLQILKVTKI